MSIMETIGRLASRIRHRRAVGRTERMILSLPSEIRKDIGWPDYWPRREERRHGLPGAR